MANTLDARHAVAARATLKLHRLGNVLHTTPQVFVEYRNVATRPVSVNGLGLAAAAADSDVAAFEAKFPLLKETPDIFPAWKAIVGGLGVVGKQVHDARLVAVCHVHSVTHLLTFNTGHFGRFAGFGPGINVVDPATV